MRILVVGASGFIGSHLLEALTATGHQVVAGVRRPEAFPQREGCTTLVVDFSRDLNAETWRPRLRGIDVVINCVGIIGQDRRQRFDDLHQRAPIALFQACRQAGVRQVIQISALGADASAFSRYHLSKKAADDYLAATDLDWVILQPSLVFGPGGRSLALFTALAALPIIPVPGDGRQALQPVLVEDLVALVRRLLEPGAPTRVRIDVVGPKVLTMREILIQRRRWLGFKSVPLWSIPFGLVRAVADLLSNWVATPFNGEALRMLRQGNRGDPRAMSELLGRPPRSIVQAQAGQPAQRAERLEARLLFLLPMLRWSLAWLWIWSGLTSAFLYPRPESYGLLAAVGVSAALAPFALMAASTLDPLLGVGLLFRRWRGWAGIRRKPGSAVGTG